MSSIPACIYELSPTPESAARIDQQKKGWPMEGGGTLGGDKKKKDEQTKSENRQGLVCVTLLGASSKGRVGRRFSRESILGL